MYWNWRTRNLLMTTQLKLQWKAAVHDDTPFLRIGGPGRVTNNTVSVVDIFRTTTTDARWHTTTGVLLQTLA